MHGRAPGPPRTAAAGASHQRPRGTPASAQLATNCRRPARQRPTTPPLCGQCCCCIGRAAPDLHLVGDARARSSPAARRGLVIRDELASDARGERANWQLLTRPSVRGLPVACSSAHAAGWRNCRAARRSRSSWRPPSTTGYLAAAGAYHAPIRRQIDGFALGATPLSAGVTTRFSGVASWCHFGNTSWLALGPHIW